MRASVSSFGHRPLPPSEGGGGDGSVYSSDGDDEDTTPMEVDGLAEESAFGSGLT